MDIMHQRTKEQTPFNIEKILLGENIPQKRDEGSSFISANFGIYNNEQQ
jgi:hypothetical protein